MNDEMIKVVQWQCIVQAYLLVVKLVQQTLARQHSDPKHGVTGLKGLSVPITVVMVPLYRYLVVILDLATLIFSSVLAHPI